jgi:hypothetical protein
LRINGSLPKVDALQLIDRQDSPLLEARRRQYQVPKAPGRREIPNHVLATLTIEAHCDGQDAVRVVVAAWLIKVARLKHCLLFRIEVADVDAVENIGGLIALKAPAHPVLAYVPRLEPPERVDVDWRLHRTVEGHWHLVFAVPVREKGAKDGALSILGQ